MNQSDRKENNETVFFSVEGQTENWYLKWLQQVINQEGNALYKVSLNCKSVSPIKRVKQISAIGRTIRITHVFDYEGRELEQRFLHTLEDMKKAERLGKFIHYDLGYSNFTFELWILLHKCECRRCLSHRRQYLNLINREYRTDFPSLSEYKEDANFHRILEQLTLADVRKAVQRSECMMQNYSQDHEVQQYRGYQYYRENPALSIGEVIGRILKECGVYISLERE